MRRRERVSLPLRRSLRCRRRLPHFVRERAQSRGEGRRRASLRLPAPEVRADRAAPAEAALSFAPSPPARFERAQALPALALPATPPRSGAGRGASFSAAPWPQGIGGPWPSTPSAAFGAVGPVRKRAGPARRRTRPRAAPAKAGPRARPHRRRSWGRAPTGAGRGKASSPTGNREGGASRSLQSGAGQDRVDRAGAGTKASVVRVPMARPPLSSESMVAFGSRVGLLAHGLAASAALPPSHSRMGNSGTLARVPIHSGGTAPDFNRFPFYPVRDPRTGRPEGPPVANVLSWTGRPCQGGKASPR